MSRYNTKAERVFPEVVELLLYNVSQQNWRNVCYSKKLYCRRFDSRWQNYFFWFVLWYLLVYILQRWLHDRNTSVHQWWNLAWYNLVLKCDRFHTVRVYDQCYVLLSSLKSYCEQEAPNSSTRCVSAWTQMWQDKEQLGIRFELWTWLSTFKPLYTACRHTFTTTPSPRRTLFDIR